MNKELNQFAESDAINRQVPELQEQLTRAIDEALRAQSFLYAYALMDSAFSETCVARYRKMHVDANLVSLYHRTELEGLADMSPFLVQLPAEPALRAQSLATLLRIANGKPMLSFLVSALDLEFLKAHFSSVLQAETEDGQRFVLRFADTRILPVLATTLDKTQQSALFWPMARWWIINRTGELAALPLPHEGVQQQSATAPYSVLPLSAQQYSSLIDAAEADAIIEQLRLVAPEQCTVFQPGSLHQFVHEQLLHATRFGVESVPDRIAYCIGAFNTNGKLHESDYCAALFTEKQWKPGDLASALAELPEECWEVTTV